MLAIIGKRVRLGLSGTGDVPIKSTVLSGAGLPLEVRVDRKWYSRAYAKLKISERDAETHYIEVGEANGLQPNPYFHPNFVRLQIARLGVRSDFDLRTTYLIESGRLSPHPLFPREMFGFGCSDVQHVRAASADWHNPYAFVLRFMDSQQIRHGTFFDPKIAMPDAKRPLHDFLNSLSSKETALSVLFDPIFYASQYPDVDMSVSGGASSCPRLLEHFILYGMDEVRLPFPDFDVEYYKSKYPDVGDSGLSPIRHFLQYGISEHRDPNPYFNTRYYIEKQLDVMDKVRSENLVGPFEHFLKYGFKMGYRANPPLYSVSVPERDAKALYEKRCEVTTITRLRSGRTIHFPQVPEPDISCVIPVSNNGEMTVHLLDQLEGIAARRDMPSIEVIVVDNGSNDVTLRLPELCEGLVIRRHEAPIGYPKAVNDGAAVARGRCLLIMNNDVEVNAGSLRRGYELLESNKTAGMVGGRVILMTGELQEAGNVVFHDGGSLGIGRHDAPTLPRHAGPRWVDYAPGCFMFVRREDFDRFGGFEEEFSPGYYEEADLAIRMTSEGLGALYDPEIYVYHYEYASFSKGRPPSASTVIMRRNRRIFLRKHKDKLRKAPPPRVTSALPRLAFAADLASRRRIAFVEDYLPARDIGSGFVRAMDIIDSLLARGHLITLFELHYRPRSDTTELRQKGVEIVRCFTQPEGSDPLEGREWDFDVVWVSRTHNAVTWAARIDKARMTNPNLKYGHLEEPCTDG